MKWRQKRSLALLFFVSALVPACRLRAQAPGTATPPPPAPPVVAVRIVTQDGRVLSESPQGIAITLGQPLDTMELRAALHQLYRTGDYSDIEAQSAEVPGGVRLDFAVRENFYFNEVRFDGLVAPPSDVSAAAAMQINLGDIYRKDSLDEGISRLRDTLQQEGFYSAKVTAESVPHAETQQLDVIVHVTPGRRARVGEIRLLNHTEYPDRDLLARSKLKAGLEITSARMQRAGDRIRKFLVKKGHLSARAVLHRGDYDAAKNTVPVQLEVTKGPLVRVAVNGARFSTGTLRRLVPIYQEGAVDADLLEEGRRNILEELERQGFFDANVTYTTEERETKRKSSSGPETEELIAYQVERGGRHRLVGIEITGNHYFNDELLRSRLKIIAAAFASRGRFSRRLIEADRLSMQNLYSANGFLDAKVEAPPPDKYKGKEGDLFVHFIVNEGVQTRVASLTIEGNHAFSNDELLAVIGSVPGQSYSDFNVAADRGNILAWYFNEGFPEARFQSSFEKVTPANSREPSAASRNGEKGGGNPVPIEEVRLSYRIEEGPQTRVRRVLLSGQHYTRPGVIRREISLRPGEPLREGEVVESQRQLYNLGIFNRVTIQPQNPAGSNPQKNVVALVEEAKRYTLAYGGGFEVQRLASTTDPTGGEWRASPRGILEVSKANLTGRADTLSLKVRGSTLQGRALLGYFDPNTFAKKHFSFQATAYAEKSRDINTFTQTRYEGSVQLTQKVGLATSFLYRYAFRKVLVTDLKIQPQQIPLFNAPTLVSEFGVTWFRDHRNDPADPTKGSFNNIDFSVADTDIGSSASFVRFFAQNSTYYPIKRRFSFARSARFGMLRTYRDTVSPTFAACPPSTTPPPTGPVPTVIPLPERFFAGGGTSLRGFALNQSGPRDPCTGFPVGGQAILVLNQEFRFPMRVPYFGTRLGGALFYDAGNVYSRVSSITFRASPPKPVFDTPTHCRLNCSNELNYFSHTIGIGVRYSTPVGPIRVDLGYQLNRATFVIPCTSGAADCFQSARLPGFQIFFNLGAPF